MKSLLVAALAGFVSVSSMAADIVDYQFACALQTEPDHAMVWNTVTGRNDSGLPGYFGGLLRLTDSSGVVQASVYVSKSPYFGTEGRAYTPLFWANLYLRGKPAEVVFNSNDMATIEVGGQLNAVLECFRFNPQVRAH